ncbi:MAG: fatty acid desaturase [Alphaproteobacteria bacterium]|nr:fatty acid desaturase [Alphaproteobacteria bacterium]
MRDLVKPYARPQAWRAVRQLVGTGLPYLATMAAMLVGLAYSFWALLAVVPAALCLVRLFMIQHDCGHGSFFRSSWANNLVGNVLGVLTLTPYVDWQRCHAAHHATNGNLDRRGIGDITTLTVREYLGSSRLQRACYRLGRHPLVLFGIGPAYQFLLRHRIPGARQMRRLANWLSAMGTNLAVAAIVAGLAVVLGLKPILFGMLPVMVLAATIGIWLFYVQHQFEETYWETGERWSYDAAALEGSSYYDLPRFLHWLTANIGFHHIHHLSSKVPNYRLSECFHENPPLWAAKRLTIRESFKCLRLALWDEDARRLVPFKALRRR